MVDGKMQTWGYVLCVLCLFVLGCGRGDLPDLGYVSGTVKMDGEPLPGVVVRFNSEGGGRPGAGLTNSEGEYELTYVAGVEGTKLGPALVAISTEWPEGEPPDGESEPIPSKYNSKTTLKETVVAGNNTFDFNLESE